MQKILILLSVLKRLTVRAAHYLQTCLFLTQPPSHTGVECEVAYKSTL